MAINYENLKDGGLKYVLLKLKDKLDALLASKVDDDAQATDSVLGLVKTNSGQNITLNAAGQLEVGGRLGQTAEGGLYAPVSMTPKLVETNALLLSKMSGLSVANGALALLRGGSVTVKSAPAGTTEYHVSNTYANRLICAGLQTAGAVCIINEAAEPTGEFSTVLSCTIGGAAFVPHTGADDPDNDIVITVDKSANPNDAVTQIRFYQAATKSSSFYAGQMVGGGSGLANVIVGQNVFSPSGNVICMIAAQSYNTGNGNAIFGRYHYVTRNRWLVSGTGHEVASNARAEAGGVVGQYADIQPDTLFAVGNGANQLNRSNAFEVKESGVSLPQATFIEIVDKNLVGPFNTTNYSKTSAVVFAADGTMATFPDSTTALYVTKKTTAIPVTPGEVINWEYEIRKTTETVACNFGLNLMKTNATGGSATNNLVNNDTASAYSTEWETRRGSFTVPAGMTYMTPRLQKTMPSGGTATSGAYEVRNLRVSRPDGALVLSSPTGTRYKIAVDDSGNLTAAAV